MNAEIEFLILILLYGFIVEGGLARLAAENWLEIEVVVEKGLHLLRRPRIERVTKYALEKLFALDNAS